MGSKENTAESLPGQGLTVLYPEEQKDDDKFTIDIVAVPGLGADPRRSFNSLYPIRENKYFNWLSDDEGLKREFPTARVMLYEYESRWLGKQAIPQSLSNVANNLLESLHAHREKGALTRPIVFIAHSMGGIVVAKAITTASIRADDFPHMYQCFAGGIFLGTPFHGSSAEGKGVLLASMLEKVDSAVKSRVLTFLDPQNEGLEELRNEFVRISNKLEPKMNLCCFYEQKKTNYTKEKLKLPIPLRALEEIVVTEESATLTGVDSIGLACSHRQLNRFDGVKDGRYELVRSRLKRIVVKARTLVRARLNASRQSLMDDATLAKILTALEVGNLRKKRDAVAQLSGSSSWILENPIFKEWSADESAQHSSIWICGQEGKGKSKAAVSIIEKLEERERQSHQPGESGILVAYFFCDSTIDLSSAENVLKSLLWQLIFKRRALAQYAKDFAPSEKSNRKGGGGETKGLFTVENLWSTLQEMLKDPSIEKVYFVINSLHELPEDSNSTKQLLARIRDDVLGDYDANAADDEDADSGKKASMRWMFTSRRRENIKDTLARGAAYEIDLDDPKYGGALQKDLKDHARSRVAQLAKTKGYSAALQYFVSSLVEKKAENTVWIDVVCEKLEHQSPSHVAVRRALEGLPQDLPLLLDNTWSSVLDPHNENVEWTKEILRTLMIAFEDPTVDEFAVIADLALPEDDRQEKLLSYINSCGPLVKLIDRGESGDESDDGSDDEGGSTEQLITFLHPTAKARLQERARDLLGVSEEELKWQHGILGLRCFAHVLDIMMPQREPVEGAAADESDDEGEPDPSDAQPYTLKYWLRHAREATVDVVDNLNLENAFWQLSSEARTKWWQLYTTLSEEYDGLKDMTALHIAALFGFTPLAVSLLEHGHADEVHKRDSWDNQPLHWAADQGHMDIIELLLEKGADINDGKQDHVWTPLHMAASSGRTNIISFFLNRHENPADINAVANDDGTPLTLAIKYGQTEAAKLLLHSGADACLTGEGLEPPLALAAAAGDLEVLDLVLQAGGAKNVQSPTHGSALAAAASSGEEQVVQRVLGVDGSTRSGQLALEQAAESGYADIATLLLGRFEGLQCDTAFSLAAAKGHDGILNLLWEYSGEHISQKALDGALYVATDFELESTVKLLLGCGADANASGEPYGDALTAAAYDGTSKIIDLLLAAGAQVNSPSGHALQAAAFEGHEDVVRILLDHHANVNARSDAFEHGTALQGACASGYEEIVELLLDHGANPDLGGGDLTCPVIAATRHADAAILELLINAGANVNVVGGPGMTTPLNNAAMSLPADSLKLLIDKGHADVNAVDQDGDTALKVAASVGDADCVALLLDRHAKVDHSKGHLGTALHAAAASGSAACCRLLLDHGADAKVRGGPFNTVLQAAAASGDKDTLELVLAASRKSDVTATGGMHFSALHAAAMQKDSRCVRLLLAHGAAVGAIGGDYGTPLQAAAFAGCNRNVRALLDARADPTVVAGKFGTAVQAAALKCERSTCEALLEAGARLDGPPSGKYRYALVAASVRYETDVLEWLLEKRFPPEAYKQALEASAKCKNALSFSLIRKSEGGKAVPKEVVVELRKILKADDDGDGDGDGDGDENSDFGDDVIYNYQDPDGTDSDQAEDSDSSGDAGSDPDEHQDEAPKRDTVSQAAAPSQRLAPKPTDGGIGKNQDSKPRGPAATSASRRDLALGRPRSGGGDGDAVSQGSDEENDESEANEEHEVHDERQENDSNGDLESERDHVADSDQEGNQDGEGPEHDVEHDWEHELGGEQEPQEGEDAEEHDSDGNEDPENENDPDEDEEQEQNEEQDMVQDNEQDSDMNNEQDDQQDDQQEDEEDE